MAKADALLNRGMPDKKSKLRRYPWDEWFTKSVFKVVKGKDFVCQVHTMTIQIRTAAAARDFKVSIHVEKDKEITVHVSLPQ